MARGTGISSVKASRSSMQLLKLAVLELHAESLEALARFAATFAFRSCIDLSQILGLVGRTRRLEASLDEFIRRRCAAEAFRGGGDFGIAQEQVANGDVGVNFVPRFFGTGLCQEGSSLPG